MSDCCVGPCPYCDAPDQPAEQVQICIKPGCVKPAVFVTMSDRFLCEGHREGEQ